MAIIRRVYIYIVCAISLNALVWGVINLVRNLSLGVGGTESLAMGIAVSVVSLGMYLAHWLWARRLAAASDEERRSGLRRFYLYASMAGFLVPVLVTLNSLLANLLGLSALAHTYPAAADTLGTQVIYDLIAIFSLLIALAYHLQVVRGDESAAGAEDRQGGIRRLFIYTFAAVGLGFVIAGVVTLAGLVIHALTGDTAGLMAQFKRSLPDLLIGLPLWLYFWLLAQRLFALEAAGERLSVVRKLYQYGFIFSGVLAVVFNAALILNQVLRRALGLSAEGDWRAPLPIMLVMGVVWLYHAAELRREQPGRVLVGRAGGIQRLYLYLVAGSGLLAVLAGLVGLIAVLLISIEEGFGNSEREMLAWTTAALLVGLPVWLLHWYSLQSAARRRTRRSLPEASNEPEVVLHNTIGEEARSSLARKIYLYLYIFLATISVLGGLIFVVFRLVGASLGEDAATLSELGIALAFTLIGVGVWVYHGTQLRIDGSLSGQSLALQIQQLNLLAIALPESPFAESLRARIAREMPQASLRILEAKKGEMSEYWLAQIEGAGVLILPFDAWNQLSEGRRASILSSPARKLLVPVPLEGWAIVGLDQEAESGETILDDLVAALQQIAAGLLVRQRRPTSPWAIVGIIFLVLVVLIPTVIFLINLML